MRTQKDWVPAQRTLVLLDLENLAGGPYFGVDTARCLVTAVLTATKVRHADHVIVGCNPAVSITATHACPRARLVIGSGRDGADRALIDAADPLDVARRYRRCVIGSGDHLFAPLAGELRRHGLRVTVVARQGSISQHLVPCADEVLTIVPPRVLAFSA